MITKSYFSFESEIEFLGAMGESSFPFDSSVVYPNLMDSTGQFTTFENGDKQEILKKRAGFFVSVLGEYPVEIEPFKVEVKSPSYKWA